VLRQTLTHLEGCVRKVPLAGVRGVIVPHAGYQFSGRVAMAAYARLDVADYKRVVVVGPSHYAAMENCLSWPGVAEITTPLGSCRVDTEWLDIFAESGFLRHEPQAHRQEHSDQIQLPLLQHLFARREWSLVPLVCGQFDDATATACGERLRLLLDEESLLVISTDFTHYGVNFGYVPFEFDVAQRLEELDHEVFAQVVAGNSGSFWRVIRETGATVCGVYPLALLLAVMGGRGVVEEVAYDLSGNITGDWENSVSYLSATLKW